MTSAAPPGSASPGRSTFVTVLAWIFIILSGFTTFISLLQNMMIGYMPRQLINGPLQDTTFSSMMPSGARFMFTHFRLLVFGMLIVCVATLVSSIGLLHRRNWARLVFIGLLGLGILYSIAGLIFQQSMMSGFPTAFPVDSSLGADSITRQTTQQFNQMMAGMRVFMFVFTAGSIVLFAWIIARLVSPTIREEFTAP